MDSRRVIRLDMIDGFGFERACADIFAGAGLGHVEQLGGGGADGGIDLLIRGRDGSLTAVECKHHPNGSIGRPVVQKLHSAVISSGASRGIVVTTGRFTEEAKEHAEELSRTVRISLFDRSHLADLADRAGIRLAMEGGRGLPMLYLPDAGDVGAREAVMSGIAGLQSYPSAPGELARMAGRAVRLEPYYLARADVEQDFSTSVGLIHSVSERDVPVLVDAQSRSVCSPRTTSLLSSSPLEEGWGGGADEGVRVQREGFACGEEDARDAAAAHLASLYTQEVSYTGRNNVRYRKTCQVSPRSVHFTDFKQVLLPVRIVEMQILQSRYTCSIVRDGEGIEMSAPGLEACGVCKKGVRTGRAALCNACGSVHHRPSMLGGHGYRCKECRKNVCRRCAFWTRRMLFFKRIVCGGCASGLESAQRMR